MARGGIKDVINQSKKKMDGRHNRARMGFSWRHAPLRKT